MKNYILLLLLFIGQVVFTQSYQEPCEFDTYKRQNANWIESSEKIIQDYLINVGQKFDVKSSHNSRVIPVVVHIIHNGGVENITELQVQSQIDVLNEDFRKMAGTNGDGNGVDTEIEFCLAKLSPEGHCTNGIVRVQSPLTNHLTYERSLLKQLSYWDNTRYLNMYIVKSINGNSGIAGYSSFPGGPADEDGIVVRYNYFGRIGNIAFGSNGRTTTHEISHWFGLYHTFNNGCGIDTCSDGDYVCDTPPAIDPNYGCPNVNTCSNDFPDVNDQIENYCDYSNDACKNMFTAGQKARMDATLNTFRAQIWSGANITSTGCNTNFISNPNCPPQAKFTAINTAICIGGSISYTSNSLNRPTSFNWQFFGGTPSTSNSPNPTVVYNSVGVYDVTLIVSNANGTDTLVLFNYISVNTPVPGMPNTWGDDFENSTFPTNGLTIENPDNGITWERTTDASLEGIASVRIQNLINTNYGQSDALVLPSFDFTSFTTPINMVFRWAYARSDANYSDELIVLVSNDCGNTWTQEFYLTGNALVTGATQTTLFVPDSTEWNLASIDLSAYDTSELVDIKIVNVTDGGNALYIDSLKVGIFDFDSLPSSLANLNNDIEIVLFPNPTTNVLHIEFNRTSISPMVNVFNSLGQKMKVEYTSNNTGGLVNTGNLSTGLYWIEVMINEQLIFKQFVKD
jgi:PKD repeat protein